jgi:c-di-GMP-binding flagellar brake protein YcgR
MKSINCNGCAADEEYVMYAVASDNLAGSIPLEVLHEVPHDDRRTFVRRPASHQQAYASVGRARQPVSLELRDLSVGGAGAWTSHAISRGESIHLTISPDGRAAGFTAHGKVVRCEPSAFGYRIGVQFDRPLGA